MSVLKGGFSGVGELRNPGRDETHPKREYTVGLQGRDLREFRDTKTEVVGSTDLVGNTTCTWIKLWDQKSGHVKSEGHSFSFQEGLSQTRSQTRRLLFLLSHTSPLFISGSVCLQRTFLVSTSILFVHTSEVIETRLET